MGRQVAASWPKLDNDSRLQRKNRLVEVVHQPNQFVCLFLNNLPGKQLRVL